MIEGSNRHSGATVWNVLRWAVASNERAVANARMGALECSKRRLEHAEVELYLAKLSAPPTELVSAAGG